MFWILSYSRTRVEMIQINVLIYNDNLVSQTFIGSISNEHHKYILNSFMPIKECNVSILHGVLHIYECNQLMYIVL